MWALRNKTPYAAERNWVRDKDGIHWWLVAIRATFEVDERGGLALLDEQPPPFLAPEHHGEAGASSLRYDSDLLALKPTTDILVVGHAHAPGGRPAHTVDVTLRAGSVEKVLVVYGDRVYYDGLTGLTTTKPQAFKERPIIYEHAFGGGDFSDPDPSRHHFDERNPVGRGYSRHKSALLNTPAHCIEYPNEESTRRTPAGLGAIDRGWLPRRSLAGTYDAQWVEQRKPLLPVDYDPAFALAAPADQRPQRAFVGGEKIGLFNMTPSGRLIFDLPRTNLSLTSRFGRQRRPHKAPLLATVLLEPQERRVSVVWQSGLRVPAPQTDYLDQTEIEVVRV